MPIAEVKYGSKCTMSLLTPRIISPPYWGTPRESHQWPLVGIAVVVVAVACEVVAVVVLGVVVIVVSVTFDVVAVVDFVLQDTKSSDVTMKQVNTIQIVPLFTWASYLFFN